MYVSVHQVGLEQKLSATLRKFGKTADESKLRCKSEATFARKRLSRCQSLTARHCHTAVQY